MHDIRRWFLWTLIIGPIHMSEQLLTSLDELQELKGFTAKYYGWFTNADVATVVLVMIMFSLMNLIVYALLLGGRPRLIAVGLFAAVALGEAHHIIKTVVHAAYFPGAVTAIPFFVFGLLLLARSFASGAQHRRRLHWLPRLRVKSPTLAAKTKWIASAGVQPATRAEFFSPRRKAWESGSE